MFDLRRRVATYVPSISSMGAQGAWLLVQVVITPILLEGLGPSSFGTYSMMMALLVLVMSLDLGIGNALVTNVVRADRAGGDVISALAHARRVLWKWCAGLAALGVVWTLLLTQASVEAIRQWAPFGLVLAAGALTIPFALAPRIRLALGQLPASSAWAVGGSILGGTLAVAIVGVGGSALVCVLGVAVGRLAGLAGDTLTMPRKWRGIRQGGIDATGIDILRDGRLFWFIQIASVVAYNLDVLVVGAIVDEAQAGTLAIASRIVMLVPLFVGIAAQPLWRRFASLGSARESERLLAKATIRVSFGAFIVLAIILALRDEIVSIWLGASAPEIPGGMWVALTIWAFMSCVTAPVSVFLNAHHVLRTQLLIALVASSLNLGASIVLALTWGAVGPVWASVIVQGLVIWPGAAWQVRRELRAAARIGPSA